MGNRRSYEIVLRKPTGEVIRPIGNAISVKWALKENKPGTAVLDLPVENCNDGWTRGDFGEDYLIDIWRHNTNGTRKRVGNSSFMVQNIWSVRENSVRRIRLECDDGKALMSRRINAFRTTSTEQDYSGNLARPLDNFMASVFRKTFGDQELKYVTTNFPVFGYIYTLEQDLNREIYPTYLGLNGGAPALSVNLTSWNQTVNQTTLALFQKATDYAASKGENLFWDVTSNPTGTTPIFTVNIYVGLRGLDRTKSVLLSDFDAISDYKIGIAYRDSLRRIYVGGKKSNKKQRTAEANSTDFPAVLATNPWALREGYFAGSSDIIEDLQATADAELQKRIARETASGSIQDTDTYSYGSDYEMGDKVSVHIENKTYSVYLDSEEGTLENGTETLNVGFNSDTFNYISSSTPAVVRDAQASSLFDLYRRIQDLQSQVQYQATLFEAYDLG